MYNFDVVTSKSFFEIIKLYLFSLVSFSLGVIIYYDISNKSLKKLFNKSFTESLFFKINISGVDLVKWSRNLLFLIYILYFVVYGKSIIYREIYLPDVSRGGIVILKILSFIEAIMLAFAFRKNRAKSRLYLFFLILISIGTASRTVFLFVFLYVIIIFIIRGNTLKNKIFFIFNTLISFIFLAYLIQFRSLSLHGVYPYITGLNKVDNAFESIVFNIYYSLIFGIYVTIKTLQEATKDWHIIYISLHPLPGKYIGWYDHIKEFKLNQFAPYSLHGSVFKMGKIFTFFYFFITGIIFTYFEKKVRQYLSDNNRIVAFLIVLLLVLHIVYGFEYPLRSAFRYIYYSFFIVLMVKFFKQLKFLLKTSNNA